MKLYARMCAVCLFCGLLFVSAPVSSGGEAKSRESSDRPTMARIEEAVRAGHIDAETAILYNVYAVKDPDRLPDRFHSEKPMRCGTLSLLRAFRSMVWP